MIHYTAQEKKLIAKYKKEAEADYQAAIKQAKRDLQDRLAVAVTNAQFDSLSKPQKRVAIAKDVILQLKMKKIIAKQGVYVSMPGQDPDGDNDNACLVSPEKKVSSVYNVKGCHACAKGSLFISAARVMNGKRMKDLFTKDELDSQVEDGKLEAANVGNDEILNYLSDVFDQDQLDLMEAAFENNAISDLRDCPEDVKEAGGAYYRNDLADEPEKMLEQIMLNVIKNKGKFIPTLKDCDLA